MDDTDSQPGGRIHSALAHWDGYEWEYRVRHDEPSPRAERSALAVGEQLCGPTLIHQPDTTVLVEPGDCARVGDTGTLVVDIGADHG